MKKHLDLHHVLLLLISTCFLNAQDPIFHMDFDVEGTTVMENVSGRILEVKNTFDRPERINSNFEKALRLDGYSTFINADGLPINDYEDQLTIEVWYATDAFTSEPASIIQSQSNDGGFKLQVNSYGYLSLSYYFNGQERVLTPNKQLSTYQWHHIVASIDGQNGETNIYVDGENWLSHSFQSNSIINSSDSPLWIAKSALNQVFAGFSLNTLNGAIDDIKVYDIALSESQVLNNYEMKTIDEAPLIVDPDIRHQDDYLRPQYHPMPNTSWTNESYGLIYFNNEYHLFFQKNPNGPYLYFMHWGHLVSDDLVNWREIQIPLAPSPGFDDFGVWSGTTIKDENGDPVIFYTGVDGRKAGIGNAYPQDDELLTWKKNRSNPLIPHPPSGFSTLDFRDPYVLKIDDTYFMIVGSGLTNNGGGILFLYKSDDLDNWELIDPIYQSRDFEAHGTFWEMPSFLRLNESDYAIVVTPQFQGAPADVLYWVGSFDGSTFTPYSNQVKYLEPISTSFLAPAFGKDKEGKTIYTGIIPDDRSEALQIAAGWRHTFSLPRMIRLLNDGETLASIPHPNLCRLRLDTMEIINRTISPGTNNNLPEFTGNQSELEFNLEFQDAESIVIEILRSQDGSEKTSIVLDRKNSRLGLDRRISSPYQTVEDFQFQDYTYNPSGDVYARIYIDHSVIEVFIDNLVVFSSRVYPSENSNTIDIKATSGDAEMISFKGHQLKSKDEPSEDISCEVGALPNRLFTTSVTLPNNTDINVYPNPTDDMINIETEEMNDVFLIDLNGKLVFRDKMVRGSIDVQHMISGIYFLKIRNRFGIYTTKIIIN